jgi:hypothetical protein
MIQANWRIWVWIRIGPGPNRRWIPFDISSSGPSWYILYQIGIIHVCIEPFDTVHCTTQVAVSTSYYCVTGVVSKSGHTKKGNTGNRSSLGRDGYGNTETSRSPANSRRNHRVRCIDFPELTSIFGNFCSKSRPLVTSVLRRAASICIISIHTGGQRPPAFDTRH